MAIVVLDIAKFRAMFPEFSNVDDALIPFLFDPATDYLNNSEYSLVDDAVKRERLLYLLMAHIAYMRYGDNRKRGGSGMVGRIASATEGSVSVSTDLGPIEFRYAWYTQSPYGMDFWQATKVYRMAQYYPGDAE
ncbi:DUF4054 domain-containing protein [Pectobacterium brasiliense]|uniref:DUF4054 domain-containing protein n=1 Tax=Pectobacterium brasiliense TaxID=180957 RepID=UPI000B96C1A8|nr:DUF4054 domain-containing protein [Pectobacterium carotovorum]OYN49459.1 hypothetical protein B7L51_19515 [Pectobacterium carotovorum]